MKHDPIILDEHRGMAAQQATEIRRRLAEVEADQAALRERRTELEKFLLVAPAATWVEAAEKARYLIGLLSQTSIARDPRRQKLIAGVLDDFVRLSGEPAAENTASRPGAGDEVGRSPTVHPSSRASASSRLSSLDRLAELDPAAAHDL